MLTSIFHSFHKFVVFLSLTALPSVITEHNFDVCEMAESGHNFREGILGEVGEFPWLGVLRVPVKHPVAEDQDFGVAATGAVLVTVKYVAVNADDMSKTTQERLKHRGSVHFVPATNKTWTSKLKNLIFHPEYEYATLNTIALVEMETDVEYEDQEYRANIKPVCWPGIRFNTSNALYVTGFTDERMLLEKVLFKAQYVPKSLCEEFYKRQYLKVDKMQEPQNYVCTYAPNKKESCQWDHGMVLVSNVTGHWTIVGFGVAGPGCSAPTRFIDMSAYTDWIQTSTRDPLIYDYYGGRDIDTTY